MDYYFSKTITKSNLNYKFIDKLRKLRRTTKWIQAETEVNMDENLDWRDDLMYLFDL